MSQDSAGTIPAAIDSPVGRISDKSGNNNHALQAMADSRPILRRSGGVYHLEFDGVDDKLAVPFAIAQPWDRISAIRQMSWTNLDRIFGGVSANRGHLEQRTSSPSIGISSAVALTLGTGAAVGVDAVITERHAGASSRGAINSGAYVTGDAGADPTDGITLGGGGAGNPANVRIYGVCMIGRPITDVETTALRKYLAAKSGASL
jgi:hypothetical protein